MNSKHPKISVVIPAFNEEKYLPRCLESLRLQTFRDFEVIVVDNNSTDKTGKIAQKYDARVVKELVQGMTPARERGFSEAKAEIIVKTDADAVFPKYWLETFYQAFSMYPDTVAIGGSHFCSELDKFQNLLFSIYMRFNYYLSRLLMGHYQLYGPNYAIRKSAWKKIHVHTDDKIVHEDIDLPCHLLEVGKIVFSPEIKNDFSLRRFKRQFLYTFFEYSIRYFRTIWLHHPYFRRHNVIRANSKITSAFWIRHKGPQS